MDIETPSGQLGEKHKSMKIAIAIKKNTKTRVLLHDTKRYIFVTALHQNLNMFLNMLSDYSMVCQ